MLNKGDILKKFLCYVFILLSIVSFIHFLIFSTAMPFLIVGNLMDIISVPWFSVTKYSIFMTPILGLFGSLLFLKISSKISFETFKQFRSKLDSKKKK